MTQRDDERSSSESRVPLSSGAPLYAILDASVPEDLGRERLAALAAGGCRMVQLRAKSVADRECFALAASMAADARALGVRFIINDRADIARLAGADGVHLGQEDLSVAAARRILGDSAIIGLSTHTAEQIKAGDGLAADYLAIGPVFETRSKAEPDPVVGLDGVREARRWTRRPLVAIGGLTLDNARDVIDAGADGLAIISALARVGTKNLEAETRRWTRLTQ